VIIGLRYGRLLILAQRLRDIVGGRDSLVCRVLLGRALLVGIVVWFVVVRRHPDDHYRMRNPSAATILFILTEHMRIARPQWMTGRGCMTGTGEGDGAFKEINCGDQGN
jgi:hypothetical protein